MNKIIVYCLFVCLMVTSGLFVRAKVPVDNATVERFKQLTRLDWVDKFRDNCTGQWEKRWILDGKMADVSNSRLGMTFWAGPIPNVDAHHAVLWTRKAFQGDLKIEWDYTRLDTAKNMVTILYFHAQGNESKGVDKDIRLWAGLREIPAMKTYFNNMDLLHISYAAFGAEYVGQYLRARRYRPDLDQGIKGTDLGAFGHDVFFETGVKHHVTVIKKGVELFMKIENNESDEIYQWDLSGQPEVNQGYVGLRHMYTRGALYKDIVISEL